MPIASQDLASSPLPTYRLGAREKKNSIALQEMVRNFSGNEISVNALDEGIFLGFLCFTQTYHMCLLRSCQSAKDLTWYCSDSPASVPAWSRSQANT